MSSASVRRRRVKPALRKEYLALLPRFRRLRSKRAVAAALGRLEALARSGIDEAWFDLFEQHRKRRDRRRARACVEHIFAGRDAELAVTTALACISFDHTGTPSEQRRRGFDPGLGLSELERRARLGDLGAMYWLSRVYEFGGPIPRNSRLAVAWTRRAAEAGDLDSITNLGVRYRYGHGVRRRLKEAVRWYELAAKKGCPSALANLGRCYWNGEGVIENKARAVTYFARAARAGNRSARAYLADARIDGIGMKRAWRRGWNELLALGGSGNTAAGFLLAERMIEGRGCPREKKWGQRWLAWARKTEDDRSRYFR